VAGREEYVRGSGIALAPEKRRQVDLQTCAASAGTSCPETCEAKESDAVRFPTTQRRTLVFLGVAAVVWPAAARSQAESPSSEEPATVVAEDDLATAVADAQKANLVTLAKFSWRVKSELSVEGQSKAATVTAMQFGPDGKLEVVQISAESTEEEKGGLRGRRQDKKKEDHAEYLKQVLDQSFKYIFLSKGTLVDVFDRGKVTETEGGVQVAVTGLMVEGDELSMSIDPSSKLVTKLNFKTSIEEDTIQGTVSLSKMENGPNRPETLELEIPSKQMKIQSQTSSWAELR
jgi:hypothetical protein